MRQQPTAWDLVSAAFPRAAAVEVPFVLLFTLGAWSSAGESDIDPWRAGMLVLSGILAGLAVASFQVFERHARRRGRSASDAAFVPSMSFAVLYVLLRVANACTEVDVLTWRSGDACALAALPVVPWSFARIRRGRLSVQVVLVVGSSLVHWVITPRFQPGGELPVVGLVWVATVIAYHVSGRDPIEVVVRAGGAVVVRVRSVLRCAYCHGGFEQEGPCCPSCRTVLHTECWLEARFCPTLGCPRRVLGLARASRSLLATRLLEAGRQPGLPLTQGERRALMRAGG